MSVLHYPTEQRVVVVAAFVLRILEGPLLDIFVVVADTVDIEVGIVVHLPVVFYLPVRRRRESCWQTSTKYGCVS